LCPSPQASPYLPKKEVVLNPLRQRLQPHKFQEHLRSVQRDTLNANHTIDLTGEMEPLDNEVMAEVEMVTEEETGVMESESDYVPSEKVESSLRKVYWCYVFSHNSLFRLLSALEESLFALATTSNTPTEQSAMNAQAISQSPRERSALVLSKI
jgi:hypothetical protein